MMGDTLQSLKIVATWTGQPADGTHCCVQSHIAPRLATVMLYGKPYCDVCAREEVKRA